jgi:hypothetical protein
MTGCHFYDARDNSEPTNSEKSDRHHILIDRLSMIIFAYLSILDRLPKKHMPADYVKLAQTYLQINPSRQQSYFAALTRFMGESPATISMNWLKAEYLRQKLTAKERDCVS